MEPICNCQKVEEGSVPLFLTRTSVALKEHSLPELPSNFVTDYPLEGEIQYTTRILRNGYVYIYDDVKAEWLDYYVTSKGFYYLLPPNSNSFEQALDNTDFSCQHNADASGMASFISLKSYKEGCFYLIWSPIKWTDETRAKFNSASFRQQHMHKFESGSWYAQVISSGTQAEPPENGIHLSQLENTVAEYSDNGQRQVNTLSRYTAEPWINRDSDFSGMIKRSAERVLFKGGLILNLSDPTGMAADIAEVIKATTEDKIYNNTKDDFNRQLYLSKTIDAIVEEVKVSYLLLTDDARIEARNLNHAQNEGWISNTLFDEPYPPSEQKKIEQQSAERYLSHIDQTKKQAFEELYLQTVTELNNTIITPLAKLHVELMDSQPLLNQFAIHFDGSKQQSNHYTLLFLSCIRDTGEQQLCAEQHLRWYQGSDDNVLMNAIAGNNQEVKDALINMIPKGTNPSIVSPELFDIIKLVVDQQKLALLNQILEKTSRAIVHLMTESAEHNAPINAMVSRLGLFDRTRLLRLESLGTKSEFIKYTVNEVRAFLRANGSEVNTQQLQKKLADQYRALQLRGTIQDGQRLSRGFVVVVDLDGFRSVSDVSTKVMTEAQANELKVKIIQGNLNSRVGGIFRGLSILAQVSSTISLYNTMKEHDERFIEDLDFYRVLAMSFSVLATSLETRAGTVVLSQFISQRTLSWMVSAKFLGRVALAFGIVLGVLDMIEGMKYNNVNLELARGLYIKGILTIILAVTLYLSGPYSIPVAIVLFIAFKSIESTVSLLVDELTINDLEKWLMRTKWGVFSPKLTTSERNQLVSFNSMKQEQEGLQALAQKNAS